ncbi:MAG: VPLPA-CTERM sorting domain-containing protein [Gammaproteobacteria bacterium]|nr:VPLPA-CTERM sorting domain-containing protein [Gammaproteobacteria bacterium]
MKYPYLKLAALLPCFFSIQTQAAPVFQLGVENSIGFHGVANKLGSVSSDLVAGDILYGIINANNIYTTANGTTWNDKNTPAYDTLTAYFAAKIVSVDTYIIPPGFGAFSGTFTNYTFGALGSTDVDPGNVFNAADKAAQTLVKLYTDTNNGYKTNGPVATDISQVTDGTLWASFGFANGGYWTASTAPIGNGTSGGVNFISNNTGLNWGKVLDTTCGATNGCLVDMAFESSFSQTTSGAWSFSISDPARMNPVPIPAAAWLLGSGLLGFGAMLRKRKVVS